MKPEIVEIPKVNKTREMMDELRKIMEKYELPPSVSVTPEDYFIAVRDDIVTCSLKWRDHPFAEDLAHGAYTGIIGWYMHNHVVSAAALRNIV